MDRGSINSEVALTSSSKAALSSIPSGFRPNFVTKERSCGSILAEQQALKSLYERAALSYINEKCTTKDPPDNLILNKMADQFSHINSMISNLKPFQSSLSGMRVSKEISSYNLLFIYELKQLLHSWCQDFKLAKKTTDLKRNMHLMIDKWVKGFPHHSDQMHFLTKEICDTFETQISLLKNNTTPEEDLVDNFVQYIMSKYPNVIWSEMDNTLLTLPEPHTKELCDMYE